MAVDQGVSILMLGAVIWALCYLLPKARRDRDWFGVACSLLTRANGPSRWLLLGTGTRSERAGETALPLTGLPLSR